VKPPPPPSTRCVDDASSPHPFLLQGIPIKIFTNEDDENGVANPCILFPGKGSTCRLTLSSAGFLSCNARPSPGVSSFHHAQPRLSKILGRFKPIVYEETISNTPVWVIVDLHVSESRGSGVERLCVDGTPSSGLPIPPICCHQAHPSWLICM